MLEGDLEQRIMEKVRQIPAFDKLGLQVLTLSPGKCIAVAPHDKEWDGIFKSFHGGLLMTVADTIACFALMTLTGPDQKMATTDMNIRFLAPCMSDVQAEATVIKAGRTLCPVQVDLYDTERRHIAIAQVSYMRL